MRCTGYLLLAGLISALCAQTLQPLLSYQGIVTQGPSTPNPDSTYTFVFSLYADSSGTDALWQEQKRLHTSGGLFSTLLGSQTPLGSLSFQSQYWLGIAIDGREIASRTTLSGAAYALFSLTAGHADSADFSHAAALATNADSSTRAAHALLADSATIAAKALIADSATFSFVADSALSALRADSTLHADTAHFARTVGPRAIDSTERFSSVTLQTDTLEVRGTATFSHATLPRGTIVSWLRGQSDSTSVALLGAPSNRHGGSLEFYPRDHPSLSGQTYLSFGGRDSLGFLQLRHGATNNFKNIMRILPSGRIGINTTSAEATVHINRAADAAHLRLHRQNGEFLELTEQDILMHRADNSTASMSFTNTSANGQ